MRTPTAQNANRNRTPTMGTSIMWSNGPVDYLIALVRCVIAGLVIVGRARRR